MDKYNRVFCLTILILITIITRHNCSARNLANKTSKLALANQSLKDARSLFSKEKIALFSKMIAKLADDLKNDLKNASVNSEICEKRVHGNTDNGSPVVIVYAEEADEITLTSLLYEEKEPWSACRRSCKTSRIRKCRVENLCEVDVFVEEAYCYIQGSKCEKKVSQIFEEHRRRIKNDNENDENDNDKNVHEDNEETDGTSASTDMFFEEDHDYHYHNNEDYSNKNEDNANSKDEDYEGDLYILGEGFLDLFGPSDMDMENNDENYYDYYNAHSEDTEEVDDGDSTAAKSEPDASIAFTNDCGKSSISAPYKMFRIIGGREVVKGSWPWQVAILDRFKEVFCGGTLIAPNWVITAAHCLRKRLFVRIGEHNIKRSDGEIELKVVKSFKHPDFNIETIDSDIALLKISDINLKGTSRATKMACLPSPMAKLPKKQSCVVLGWGKQKENHLFGSDILRYAKVPIVGQKSCEKVYREHGITRNMFCAGALKGGLDTCEGDSGGPLLCQDEDLRWVLQGVTSFGEGCGDRNRFGVYVKVANYVQWVNMTISEN